MKSLTPSMRLKVKRDTFFLPEPNRGVYFRNNMSSFRMEGSTIVQWIEKLLPMFNGDHALSELTDGLPGPYRNRVMEIAEVLYKNDFVRDVSQDRPHQLGDQVLKKYASQIEFLDSFGDSGAYRFQAYRQEKLLAIGSGPFFISLVSALIESGLPKFHMFITDEVPTNKQRLSELVLHAHKTDIEVEVQEISLNPEGDIAWKEVVQPFDSILYVSQESDIEELRALHTVCREEKKIFLPAISLNQIGLVGPLVHPDSNGSWESAWRRIHQSVLSDNQHTSTFSSTAGAMLANVMVFEWFKRMTGGSESEPNSPFYVLNMETLEGNWHSYLPHPLVTGEAQAKWVHDFDLRIEQNSSRGKSVDLFMYFGQLTSPQTGIFHSWEEGNLKQIPLAQCRVQVVNPISKGPAELLPDIICSDLMHEEARREAGLTGIEAYATEIFGQLVPNLPPLEELDLKDFVGIGAGETFAECVCRGLQKCLDDEFGQRPFNQKNMIARLKLETVEDERCRYYLQALTTIAGAPMLGLGGQVSGFPVVWVGTSNKWYSCVGLNITMALRNALQQAVMNVQNENDSHAMQKLEVPTMFQKEMVPLNLVIPACEVTKPFEVLQSVKQVLEQNNKRLLVFEIELEPFLKTALAGIFGVLLREGESR